MSLPSRTSVKRTAAAALVAGTVLGGCSDIYYDRRETISFHGGDAPAANKAAQMIDPWPAAAANRNIAFNGERMQRAIERYRTGKTTPLATAPTSPAPVIVPATVAPVAAPAAAPAAAAAGQ